MLGGYGVFIFLKDVSFASFWVSIQRGSSFLADNLGYENNYSRTLYAPINTQNAVNENRNPTFYPKLSQGMRV